MLVRSATRIAQHLNELKARVRSHSSRTDENFKVGVEIEIRPIDSRGMPVDAKPAIERLRKYYNID